jgi:hypothetical protein
MTYDGTDISLPKWAKRKHKGKTVNQDKCPKNFNPKAGGNFTCIGCPEEKTCPTLLELRLFMEKKLGRM